MLRAHDVLLEKLIDEYVLVAKLLRAVGMGISLIIVAFNDPAHFLWRQKGVEPLTKLESEVLYGRNHCGIGVHFECEL